MGLDRHAGLLCSLAAQGQWRGQLTEEEKHRDRLVFSQKSGEDKKTGRLGSRGWREIRVPNHAHVSGTVLVSALEVFPKSPSRRQTRMSPGGYWSRAPCRRLRRRGLGPGEGARVLGGSGRQIPEGLAGPGREWGSSDHRVRHYCGHSVRSGSSLCKGPSSDRMRKKLGAAGGSRDQALPGL